MSSGARLVLGLSLVAVLAVCGYGAVRWGLYGWTVFVIIPTLVGALASWIVKTANGRQAFGTGAAAVLGTLCLFLGMGAEGLICIAMAAPLAVPLGGLGGCLEYQARSSRLAARGAAMLLLIPGMFWDTRAKPDVFEVHSSVEIAASRERVWKHVVSFSDLPEPQEWFFRAGLAYPKRARIEGSGPGAVRYCEFSTGPFVEPIEVWEEPRLLRFRVTENPAPMNEWSPYANVMPKHLHGYFISKQGQFQLTALPNGGTLLEGTTWYQHGLWPARYWSWWSMAIIHQIHMRVLNHIRTLAESDRE